MVNYCAIPVSIIKKKKQAMEPGHARKKVSYFFGWVEMAGLRWDTLCNLYFYFCSRNKAYLSKERKRERVA